MSGHGDLPEPKQKQKKPGKEPKQHAKAEEASAPPAINPILDAGVQQSINGAHNFGLTVRVEINLPADGSKETYDAIFKSIKENLLGG